MFWWACFGFVAGVGIYMLVYGSIEKLVQKEGDRTRLWIYQQFEKSWKQIDDVFKTDPTGRG